METSLADYYETLVEEYGYEPADFGLGDLPASHLRETFACADGGRAFAAGVEAGDPSLVTTGVSMTGPPHVGTLGQLRTAIRFQRAGFDVQVILADLAAYNGAGRDLEEVRTLARRYRSFARTLGFDDEAGILRTQEDATGVLRASHLLARYFDPDAGPEREPTPFESALDAAYRDADASGEETTRFAGEQTAMLLVGDTLEPVLNRGYENVCFVGGADNRGLSGWFRQVLDRSPYEGRVAGLYSKLVPGVDGYPKMCKRIPDSRIGLDEDPDLVRERVLAFDDSAVYGMMRLASTYSADELDRLRARCGADGDAWEVARETYADYLAGVAETWRESG